jgi:hypothetical protein
VWRNCGTPWEGHGDVTWSSLLLPAPPPPSAAGSDELGLVIATLWYAVQLKNSPSSAFTASAQHYHAVMVGRVWLWRVHRCGLSEGDGGVPRSEHDVLLHLKEGVDLTLQVVFYTAGLFATK